jgi:AraC family transcriptional regulator of adaptative response/methylated-DNA-[protein]-cysteine methyltransferase
MVMHLYAFGRLLMSTPQTHAWLTDYQRMTEALAYMQAMRTTAPSLADVAHQMNLSESQCQRLFQRWAGISPKRFLQCLQLETAKTLLDHEPTLLDVADQTGLSSAGRLHDLFVHIEAMTPAEYRDGGAGLCIDYGHYATPFGWLLLAGTPRGLCHGAFVDQASGGLDDLMKRWPNATWVAHPQRYQHHVAHWFDPSQGLPQQPISVLVKGTNFQVQVWRALLHIPEGQVCHYADIAEQIDRPRAVRAVGTAIGQNPVAWLIPCHRVIRQSGALGGYRWGLTRKYLMLTTEQPPKSLAHPSTD